MLTLGIGFGIHDTGVCLIRRGEVVAAIEEEKLTGHKRTMAFPLASLRTCLEMAEVTLSQVDTIAITGRPVSCVRSLSALLQRLCRNPRVIQQCRYLVHQAWGVLAVPKLLAQNLCGKPGPDTQYVWLDHHRCHAAASFYSSRYTDAAVVVVDGVGDYDTITIWDATIRGLRRVERLTFPHSLGKVYGAVCRYLGYSGHAKEGTVMALAAYGKPRFLRELEELVSGDDGLPRVREEYFVMGITPLQPSRVSGLFEAQFGPARAPGGLLAGHHMDMASSLQCVLEKVFLRIARQARQRTGRAHLCVSGGVALNCKAVAALRDSGEFSGVHVPSAPHDGGLALGAAYLASGGMGGSVVVSGPYPSPYLGPSYTSEAVVEAARSAGLRTVRVPTPMKAAARLLSDGHIVGWFQGALEYGPRALGNRSILADPRQAHLRERLNGVVKRRESFRPFAPAVLDRMAAEVFVGCTGAPCYMTESFVVDARWRERIPAVVHVDGTARVQTVSRADNERFYDLISEFDLLTGIPVVLNTSLNLRDEPIVAAPPDALRMFAESGLDYLFIGDFMFEKSFL